MRQGIMDMEPLEIPVPEEEVEGVTMTAAKVIKTVAMESWIGR